jgi:hypothetical protein
MFIISYFKEKVAKDFYLFILILLQKRAYDLITKKSAWQLQNIFETTVVCLLGSNILFTRAADAQKYILVLIEYSHSSRLYRETWITMYKHFLQLFSVYLTLEQYNWFISFLGETHSSINWLFIRENHAAR